MDPGQGYSRGGARNLSDALAAIAASTSPLSQPSSFSALVDPLQQLNLSQLTTIPPLLSSPLPPPPQQQQQNIGVVMPTPTAPLPSMPPTPPFDANMYTYETSRDVPFATSITADTISIGGGGGGGGRSTNTSGGKGSGSGSGVSVGAPVASSQMPSSMTESSSYSQRHHHHQFQGHEYSSSLPSSPFLAQYAPPSPPTHPPKSTSPLFIANQVQKLSDIAANAQRIAAQKTIEQQQAAVVATHTSNVAASVNPYDHFKKTQATVQAFQSYAAYETASKEAFEAQAVATQLHQHAAAAAEAAVTTPPQQHHQHQQQSFMTSPQTNSSTMTLAQATLAAQQSATQKQMESRAAAAAYQTTAVQAATVTQPTHAAVAKAVAENAAQMYRAAANEAMNAASTAARLEHALAMAISPQPSTPTSTPRMSVPVSLPLAGHIATGGPLPTMYTSTTTTTPSVGGPFMHPTTIPLDHLTSLPPPPLGGASSSTDTFSVPPRPTSPSQPPMLLVDPITHIMLLQHQQQQQQQPSMSPPDMLHPQVQLVLAPPAPVPVGRVQSPTYEEEEEKEEETRFTNNLSSSLQPIPRPPPSPPPSPPPTVIKAVCSCGGTFIRSTTTTGWEYEGGETRLINLPFNCSAETLFEALGRVTSLAREESQSSERTSSASDYVVIIRYRLPSDPTVWVDLVDDEDVNLMFEEWYESVLHHGGTPSPYYGSKNMSTSSSGGHASQGSTATTPTAPKLHIFVQWGDGTANAHDDANTESETGTKEEYQQQQQQLEKKPSVKDIITSKQQDRQQMDADANKAKKHRRHSHASSTVDLADLVDRMEIINARDITLIKFIGSGGYGDVYLGRWHGCEVAVKCLNPSLFFQHGADLGGGRGGGGGGNGVVVNRTAVADLIREADLLGSLRHPCIVWVYGMVLPDLRAATPEAHGRRRRGHKEDEGYHEEGYGDEEESEDDKDDDEGPDRRGGDAGREHDNNIIVNAIQAEAASSPGALPGVLRPPALVTEYMAGGSLKSALARKSDIVAGPLTRLVLALDAAKGMEYLHSKRLVHFDLKSGNLLLGYRDKRPILKICDVGLSREKTQTFVSGVTAQRGTLPWMAPEILRTPHEVTEKVDVFSFAIVLWEMWTSREPYEGVNYHNLLMQLASPEVRLRPPLPGTKEWYDSYNGGGGNGGGGGGGGRWDGDASCVGERGG